MNGNKNLEKGLKGGKVSLIPFSFSLLWIVIRGKFSKDHSPAVNKQFIEVVCRIVCCDDLWCNVKKVISIMAQDEVSKAGKLVMTG